MSRPAGDGPRIAVVTFPGSNDDGDADVPRPPRPGQATRRSTMRIRVKLVMRRRMTGSRVRKPMKTTMPKGPPAM